MKLSIHLALRYLRSSGRASFSSFAGKLAIIGLGVGIAALILTSAIYKGFEDTISNKIAGFDGHIRIQDFLGRPIPNNSSGLDSILFDFALKRPDAQIKSFVQGPAMMRKGLNAEGIILEGLNGKELPTALNKIIIDGNGQLSERTIIIGKRLADKYQLIVGDPFIVLDLSSMTDIAGMKRLTQFTIGGIFHSGLVEYDNSMVYTRIEEAQYLLNLNEEISGNIIYLNNTDFQSAAEEIESRLGYPYYTLTWKEKHHTLFKWLSVQKLPILLIFGMIALVAIVNIISALTMIVLEKIRSIGSLQAIGLSRRSIISLFLVKGTIIGLVGSIFGLTLALFFGWLQIKYHILSIAEDIYFMDHIPVSFDFSQILIIIIFGITCSLLASLWPTNIASRVKPAVALRYE
jgi:lipoprotein-releasing system permease protein